MRIRRLSILGALLVVTLLLTGSPAQGVTTASSRYVEQGGTDSGPCTNRFTSPCKTITYALAQASDGDTIRVACGVYAESLTVTKSVAFSFYSQPQCLGLSQAIISPNEARAMRIENNSTVTLSGLVLENGDPDTTTGGGGGISIIAGSTATLTNMTLRDNKALEGGGILNAGVLTVTNSTFSGNSISFTNGGAIYNLAAGTVTISNSTFIDNRAGLGGGISNSGLMTIADSTFSANIVNLGGGGIFNHNNGSLLLTTSTIANNQTTEGDGGGIYNNGTMTITTSTISGNTTFRFGGIGNGGTLTVNNSTISGNTADKGGGIYNAGTLQMTNSTIAANNGVSSAGGIYNTADGTVQSRNMLIAIAIAGDDCLNEGIFQAFNINLDSDGTCPTFSLANQNPLLGPLQDNGGPTFTHLPDSSSPAIDAGSNDACATVGNVDQRGQSRVNQDGNSIPGDGNACDLGAVERAGVVIPELNWSSETYVGNEGSGAFTAIVTLAPAEHNATVTVQVLITDSAEVSTIASVQNLTFPPNNGSQSVVIQPIDDSAIQTRTVQMALSSPNGATLGDTSSATLIFIENDTAGLVVSKRANAPQASTGDSITYTYQITNTGNVELTTISATDDKLGEVTGLAGALAANATRSATLIYILQPADVGSLLNRVTVTGTHGAGGNVVAEDAATINVLAPNTLGLTASKRANTAQANVGDTITYTYQITNTGNVALASISATDDKLGAVADLAGALAPNATRSATLTYVVQPTDVGALTNIVTITGTDAQSTVIIASADATVAILPTAEQQKEKISLPQIVR